MRAGAAARGDSPRAMSAAATPRHRLGVALLLLLLLGGADAKAHNYEDALRKSLLYFEAQRSGRLPHSQRVTWRHHSGLTDGLEQGVRRWLHSIAFPRSPRAGARNRSRWLSFFFFPSP
jgi:hypothetical protein